MASETPKAHRLTISLPILRTAFTVFAIVSGVLLICLAMLDWLAYDHFLLKLSVQ